MRSWLEKPARAENAKSTPIVYCTAPSMERRDGGIPITIDTFLWRSIMRKALAMLSVVGLILCGSTILTGCDKCSDDDATDDTTTSMEDE